MDIINDRRRRHKWSTEDRRVLCLFTKLYENSLDDATTIINHLIQEILDAEGYVDGMPTAIVEAQLSNMIRGATGHAIWRMMHDLSIPEARKRFVATRNDIEDGALDLGISLRLRAHEDNKLEVHSYGAVKRHRRKPISTAVLGDHVSSTDTEEESPRRMKRPNVTGRVPVVTPRKRVTPPLFLGSQNEDQSDNEYRRYPRFLYRWYNTHSQGINTSSSIRAGRFLDGKENIPPPMWTVAAVSNHLEHREVPSYYISFRDNLRGCLFLAMKADSHSNASITIVDLESFLAGCRQRWGSDDAAQMCHRLIERFGLEPGRNRSYTGRGEWLLYGEVEKEAIITTVNVRDILRYGHRSPIIARVLRLENFYRANTPKSLHKSFFVSPPPMDFHTGKVVGALATFLKIPQETKRQFCADFAIAWRFCGHGKSGDNQSYTDFMRGVFHEEETSDRLFTSSDDEIVIGTRHEDHQGGESASDAMGLVRFSSQQCVTAANDQDLVDAQLLGELASTMWSSTAILQSGTPTDSNRHQRPTDINIPVNGTGARGASTQSSRGWENTRPGSSRPFIFERPTVPEGPTNWDEAHSRESSPTVTEQSALDTFTAELLMKAEQCSTVGSVGRQPSTTREASEAVLAIRSGELCGKKNTTLGKTAPTLDPIVLDLSSDDDNVNDVQDLGFEIIGFRAIDHAEGSLVRKKRRGVGGTSPVRLD